MLNEHEFYVLWIAYVKSLNPEVRHISGKDNAVADMLSRARFGDDITESDNEEVSEDYFASEHICRGKVIKEFREEEYEGESLMIGKMVQDIEDSTNNKERRAEIRRKKRQIQKFFLENGLIWRAPKRLGGIPLRVVGMKEQRNWIMSEFHESDWAGHRGTWATFVKIKQKYWWKSMYKDIAEFTESCEKCQVYSGVRHRDELHPTFSPTINFK